MNAANCMKALCLAGRIILENGGETYRAEDTVIRMARALGLSEPDAFGIPSGLFISFTDEAGERKTSISRVHLRGTHLARVDRVNHISRLLADGLLAPEELYDALREASHIGREMSSWYAPLTAMWTVAGFVVMFGGGWIDVLVGCLCGALTQLVPRLFSPDDPSSGMTSVLVGGVVCVMVPLLFHSLTGLGVTEAIIAGAIMPLVPGLSMTNAVQDIMRGDMVSGVTHCARAIMIAVMVAGGGLVGTHLCGMLGLAQQAEAVASTLPIAAQAIILSLASLVADSGFGAFLYAPRKAIAWGSALGMAGYMTYWLVMLGGAPETAAMFVGALVAAVGAQLAARRLRMIATVFITIAILPMVPGLGLYRAMRALAEGQLASGGSIAAHTMALIVMIALGIAFGAAVRGLFRTSQKAGNGRNRV